MQKLKTIGQVLIIWWLAACCHGYRISANCIDQVRAMDTPNDGGGAITIQWAVNPGCSDQGSVIIVRETLATGVVQEMAKQPLNTLEFQDDGLNDGAAYRYRLRLETESPDQEVYSEAAIPKVNWFNRERVNALLLFIIFCSVIMGTIAAAKRGRTMFIRKIAGLNAIDEAIGRATEMGRKVLYVPGIMSMDDIQTIASLSILRHIARYAAEFRTNLEVPNKDPITFAATRETVREAFLAAGHADAYKESMVTYLTYDQFAYTASLSGKMVRERPATNFLIGSFYAESLLLAETGQSVGAIQIAGTAEIAQLPFFVAACDYTLIGEELYAASAYISKDPLMVGSIKGQDIVKLIIIILIVVGIVLETLGIKAFTHFFVTH